MPFIYRFVCNVYIKLHTGSRSPVNSFNNVLLPTPLGPTIATVINVNIKQIKICSFIYMSNSVKYMKWQGIEHVDIDRVGMDGAGME